MSKIILLPLLLLIVSSCTLPWSKESIPAEHNFANDYQRHVMAVFDNIDSSIEIYGSLMQYINPSWYDNSKIRISWIIPTIGSWELSIHADAVRETQIMSNMAAELDIQGFISTLDQFAKIDMKWWFIQTFSSYYYHLDKANFSGSGKDYTEMQASWDSFMKTYSSFLGKWVYLDILNIASLGKDKEWEDAYTNRIVQTVLSAESDLLTGWKKLRKLFASQSIFRVVESLGKQGDLYAYKIELDNTWTVSLVNNFMSEFSWTGISISERENIQKLLNGIILTGTLSIHADQSEYMSFSGIITSSWEKSPLAIDIAFLPSEVRMIFWSEWKEDLSFRAKDHWEASEYMLSASGKIITKGTLQRKGDSIEWIDFFLIAPKEEWLHMMYSYQNKKDFTLKIDKVTQSDNAILLSLVDLVWTIQNKKLTLLSWSISSNETLRSMQFNYKANTDGSFQWKIQSHELPGDITLDGHFQKDDILVNMSIMGMSSTFTHKKNTDKTFEWSFRFPVATMKWSGKSTKEFYDSFLLNLNSPVVSASLDMKTVDGWLSGQLKITSSQSPVDIPSIDIRAKRNKTNFSLRTDIGMWPISTDKAHFAWDSNIDVRWDKKAKVKIPTEIIPFSDIYVIFSGSNILDFPSNSESSLQGWFSDL